MKSAALDGYGYGGAQPHRDRGFPSASATDCVPRKPVAWPPKRGNRFERYAARDAVVVRNEIKTERRSSGLHVAVAFLIIYGISLGVIAVANVSTTVASLFLVALFLAGPIGLLIKSKWLTERS